MPRHLAILLSASFILAVPRGAHAQWYFSTFTGGNHTAAADVAIDQPARQTSLVFHDVRFDAKPFKSPQYYGARLGHEFGNGWAVEAEFLHLKVIARTDAAVRTTGRLEGVDVDATAPMDLIVQRYNMTHGLNFLMANVARRFRLAW